MRIKVDWTIHHKCNIIFFPLVNWWPLDSKIEDSFPFFFLEAPLYTTAVVFLRGWANIGTKHNALL